LLLSLLLALAHAATPAQVLARIDEIAALRAQRLDRGAPVLDRSVYDRAARGEIVSGTVEVPGYKAKKVWGVGVFDVPIARYWSAVNDDRSKVEWTKLTYLELLKGSYCQAPRRVFQFAEVPLITDRWWIIDVGYNAALQAKTAGRVREQAWKTNGDFGTPTASSTEWAAKGMHITSTVGAWLLVDLDGKSTLVEYYTWVDPGGSIPASLASSIAASGVDDTMAKMADLARHGPTCRLD
jgi:hypothetical protein